MDINKISFEQMAQNKGIEKSFEDFDVNNDGVINEQDAAAAAQNQALAAEITNLLNTVDEETELDIDADFDMNTLSKAGATSATDSVTAADEVGEVNPVNKTNAATQTASTTNKKEVKTMEEYKEILDCKFNELWDRFGNAESCIQYMKNNLGSFMDVTGDGRVDKIDLQILDNYLKMLPRCSSSDPVEQEKGRAYTKGIGDFARELRKQTYISTGVINDTNSYTLEDIENYAKLGGKVSYMRANLDITSIAQECNWRERLLAVGWPEGDLRTNNGQIYKAITAAEEFIKNNPDKVGYAGVAGLYKLVSEKVKHINDIDGWDRISITDMKKEMGIDAYDRVVGGYVSEAAKIDINGDGKFDAKDLAEFSTNMDLDGDGTVSCEETRFLTKVKEQMQKTVYASMATKSLKNMANIDDLITYAEYFDQSSYFDSQRSKVYNIANWYMNDTVDMDNAREFVANHLNNGGDKESISWMLNKNGEVGMPAKYAYSFLNYGMGFYSVAVGAARDGLLDGTSGSLPNDFSTTNYTESEVVDMFSSMTSLTNPFNTFLHYVQSADLSKDELQSILSKINGSSINTQYKLAEVKKAVETKLASME